MLKELAKILGHNQNELERFSRALSMVESHRWPEPKVDFETDADEFMDIAQEREK